ncbi:MAG: trypsin-like peptidase domain-containing protein [Thermofilum sp.]
MVEELQRRIIEVYESTIQSVVGVSTIRLVDMLFAQAPVRGWGSGVIVDENLVATNSHVVEGFERVAVSFHDGSASHAEVLAADPQIDIAFLEADTSGHKPAKLGDSGKLKVGQLVIAIGDPFGQVLGGPSLTLGVVSGLGRTLHVEGRIYENLIQTDAAVNPGNSGGPLMNLDGEVVGITTAMIPFAQGIGFAIPINEVKYALEQVKRHGRILRPWIGIYGLDVNPAVAAQLGLPVQRGVLVVRTLPRGPAHAAGVRPGAVILAVNGEPITGVTDLLAALRKAGVGSTVKLRVLYKGSTFNVDVEVEEAP